MTISAILLSPIVLRPLIPRLNKEAMLIPKYPKNTIY